MGLHENTLSLTASLCSSCRSVCGARLICSTKSQPRNHSAKELTDFCLGLVMEMKWGGGGQGRPASRGPRGQILKAALIWKWNHSVLKRWWKGSREKLRRSRTLRPVCSRAATSAAFLASSGRLRKNKKRETLHSDSSSEGLGVFF